MWKQRLMKAGQMVALYLFWPAVVLVAWGELTPHDPQALAHVWDKLLHFCAYFGLACLVTLALSARGPALWSVLGLMTLGAILEILQGFTGRDPSIFDELANILGATTGGGLGWLIAAVLRSKTLLAPSVERE